MTCPSCKRELTSARSKRIGYGPACYRRERRIPLLFPKEEISLMADVILIRGVDGFLRALPGRPA